MVYNRIFGIDSNNLIDIGLFTYFPSPNSFTGEEMLECHVHGSKAVIQKLFEEFNKIPQMMQALPGEFGETFIRI